jgi:hypothetical protein
MGLVELLTSWQQSEKKDNDTMTKKFLLHKEKEEKGNPAHKSKSVAAHPCNRPFAATHMLFFPTRSLQIMNLKTLMI